MGPAGPQPWLTVIGVVPDIPQSFRRPLQRDPLLYLPDRAEPGPAWNVVAHTTVPPATLAIAFRRELQKLDPNLPAQDVTSLENFIGRMRLNTTVFGILFTAFASIALVLASVGLYAVIAHAVSRRTREIGIRMALGAGRRAILTMVLGQGMRQVAIGLIAGLPVAFSVTRVLGSALIGISPGDPITFASAVSVLVLAGLLGCAIPARRAVRVDPQVALRVD